MLTVTLWVLAWLLIIVGFIGIIAPMLPGPALVYAGVVLIAWAHGFERIGPVMLLLLGLLTVIILLVDNVAAAVGTQRFGGSRWGIVGAALGTIVGMFFLPVGLVVGPLVGAVAGELAYGREMKDAAYAGWGSFVGLIGGTFVKYVLCAAMVAAALVDHVQG